MKNDEPMYTTRQAAELLGMQQNYISKLCGAGQIECLMVAGGPKGHKYMIPEHVLMDFMETREAGSSKYIPKPVVEAGKVEVISEELDAINGLSSQIKDLDIDGRLNIVIERLVKLEQAVEESAKDDQQNWMPRAKEFMEIYRQGYLEGYRNGFKDGCYKPAREKGDWK